MDPPQMHGDPPTYELACSSSKQCKHASRVPSKELTIKNTTLAPPRAQQFGSSLQHSGSASTIGSSPAGREKIIP
ncbi:uncharacterized protein N7500_001166 [Penicillium coprophilum]|uniref:uncharacterized protein n=1 Tax=Penicillium coprophilum TaxID=36646 RepID=UPI00238AA9A5|nr:uncharacterized protein N7500_001166 [Penicillium coprophilum]KAJ5178467.1 hypothetical protein N7500_001166 [Penicillium coprophilum]